LADYTNIMQKVVDIILPTNKSNKENNSTGQIPVTILLPNENTGKELTDDILDYHSNWQFYRIKNENNGANKGFAELTENKKNLYGLRLFLVFKVLGLAKTSQSVNNTSRIFNEILRSTLIRDQFDIIDQEKYKASVQHYKKYKTFSDEGIVIDPKYIQHTSYYYALKNSAVCQLNTNEDFDEDVDVSKGGNIVLATINTSIKTPQFEKNKIKLDKGKPARESITKLRSMLPDILSKTCGTAITFYIEGSEHAEIKAPLLILPKEWNEACLELKKHKPSNDLPDMNKANSSTKARNVYSLFANAKGVFMPYSRHQIPITDTSVDEGKEYNKIFKRVLNKTNRD